MSESAGAWAALSEVRRVAPLVHGITNYVAMDVTANALLAVGASPAMVHAEEEVADFAGIASSLVINIGTLSAEWVRSMRIAATTMGERGRPWVLDPVGAGATPYRTRVGRELAGMRPTVVRGNASEILALSGGEQATKGVDSVHGSERALEVARKLAADLSTVVAVTGAVDYVTDGERVLAVRNGHPLMTRVTALGCAATSLVAAFVAVHGDAVEAAAYALAVLGLAGELAAADAPGPGTLRLKLLDTLYWLSEADLSGIHIERERVGA